MPNASLLAKHFYALERRRTQALVDKDIGLARSLHAVHYQLITPAGKSFDRERYLLALQDGGLNYARWEIEDLSVRASADMALVRYRAQIEFASGNTVLLWHTDSYELLDDQWLAVWSQATLIK